MSNEDVIVSEEMCCGGKRCPVISVLRDGSVIITDDDGHITRFAADQAEMLTNFLSKNIRGL